MNLNEICEKIGISLVCIGDLRKSIGNASYKIIEKTPDNRFIIQWSDGHRSNFPAFCLWYDKLVEKR